MLTATTPTTTTARREIAAFLAIAAALSIGSNAGAAALGADMRHLDEASPLAQTLLFGAAFIPVLAAVLARWVTGQRVRGAPWGFRSCSRSWLVRSWIAPLVYVGAAGAAVWLLGLGRLDAGAGSAATAIVAVTAVVIPFVVLALGEELAWRGTFTAAVASLTTPFRTALFVGITWSAFHWPLMALVPGAVDGAPTVWAIVCFTVSITAISFPLHRLWQRTASIWPIVVFHATHNAAIYFVTDPLTKDNGSTPWFSGETGLALAVTTVSVSVWLWRRWAPQPAAETTCPAVQRSPLASSSTGS